MKKYLTIDVGGSSIKYALMTDDTNIVERSSIKTPQKNLDDFIEAIEDIYDNYKSNIEGIAISMPGIVDPINGFNYTGGALTYIHNLETVKVLQKRCPCRITVGNDAKCAANAEIGYGVLKDIEDAICVILGTGVGGCLIKDGKIHYGKNYSAGEFSFIQTDANNEFDASTVWAQVSGIEGLLKCVQKATNNNQSITGIQIFDMANQGNEAVIRGVNEFCKKIAIELYNLHMIFDAQTIAIGGGISDQVLLIDLIRKNLNQIFDSIPFVLPRTEVVPCKFRNDANLIGAMYQFISMQRVQ